MEITKPCEALAAEIVYYFYNEGFIKKISKPPQSAKYESIIIMNFTEKVTSNYTGILLFTLG